MEDQKAIVVDQGEELIDLPPGFRFHPTDEEIITHYLKVKVMNSKFSAIAVGEVDLNKFEPWDLPKKAKMGEKDWYFFWQRDRKYPTGMRTNRATKAGYWKATGKDKEIFKGKGCLVGMKKTLVFYKGRAPKGEKTNWVMHEYRLEGKFSYHNLPKGAKDKWVVCRVFHKNTGIKKSPVPDQLLRMNSFGDEFIMDYYASLPPLMDPTYSSNKAASSCNNGGNEFKTAAINSITPLPRTSDGNNYQGNSKFPTMNNNQNFLQANDHYLIQTGSSSIFNPQIPMQNPINFFNQVNPNSAHSTAPSNPDDQPIPRPSAAAAVDTISKAGADRQCKVEQFLSNHQSMVTLSQDTALSAEINNNEISSMVISSKSYEDIEDFGYLWNF